MNGLRIKAHAKINPILRVGELRPDGYHEIWTTLQAIELHDTVEITPDSETRLLCTIGELSGEANLAWKALRLLSEWVEIPSVRIFIEKRIPIEAGLGGGSSDAAAVLYAMHQMTDKPLAPGDLNQIALACGSDVPFFLSRRAAAVATGRGENLEFHQAPSSQPLLIAKPPIGHKTSDMYAKITTRSGAKQPTISEPHNDFDAIASTESKSLMDRLGGHLTGSGSAVWLQTEGAEAIAKELSDEGIWAVATRTLEFIEEPEWI